MLCLLLRNVFHRRLDVAHHGGGVVVNVSSNQGLVGARGTAGYAASKHALNGLTKVAAIEYASQRIRVNAIAPGIIDTPMHPRENHAFLRGLSPAGRIGTTAEMVDALLYLDRAEFVSGEVLHVDGGAHAGRWA